MRLPCWVILLSFLLMPLTYGNVYPSLEETYEIDAPPAPRTPKKKSSGRKDFFLITIPKSGTHLATKLLTMLTGLEQNPLVEIWGAKSNPSPDTVQALLLKSKAENKFVYQHTGTFYKRKYDSKPFLAFLTQHPEYVAILQIRDLRDVFVSLVHYLDRDLPSAWADLGIPPNASFDDKLTIVINSMLKSDINTALLWLNRDDVIVMRFEDLVGPSGGGTLASQQKAVTTLANTLGIPLTDKRLAEITQNLFGTSNGPKTPTTFYSGQIGSWKTHFNEDHKRQFNAKWGDCQRTLGYQLAK